MSKRLGETLVERGLLDEEQLREALSSQLVYGGHLGTCLIEHGFLDERELGEVLSEVYGVRYARPQEFEDIPRGVIATLQPALAGRLQAIPLRLKERTLEVALIAPGNLEALDEIACTTGCRVVSAVAPEVRIFQALERYYAVPRRIRYIALGRELDEKKRRGDSPVPPAVSPPSPRPVVPTVPVGELTFPEGAAEQQGPVQPLPAAVVDVPEEPACRLDLAAAGERLCVVRSGRDLAESVTEALSGVDVRTVLFRVKGGEATCWASRGLDLSGSAADLSFSFVSEPVFTLLLGRSSYRGEVPDEERYRSFYDRLQTGFPSEVLLYPIHVNDRIIALLYCDSAGNRRLPFKTAEVERLVNKFRLAVEMLLIKQKILAA